MVTEPFRMAAALVYAYRAGAEEHADLCLQDAAAGGDAAHAQWWRDVRAAIGVLREHTEGGDGPVN